MMRSLYRLHEGEEHAVCAAYAAAEDTGRVARKSNEHSVSSVDYARALWADGIKKGWLR